MVTQPASLRLAICRYTARFWANRLATTLLLLLCTFVCSFSRTSTAPLPGTISEQRFRDEYTIATSRIGTIMGLLHQITRPTLPTYDLASSTANGQAPLNRCPIKVGQLLALRGFSLGMSLSDVTRRFQGVAPPVSRPNSLSVRSLDLRLSRPQDPPGATGLDKLTFTFLDDRVYQLGATYSVGREWKTRPMSEFAGNFTRGLGVDAIWAEQPAKEFRAVCGEVRFGLSIDDDTYDSMSSSPRMPIAVAFFTVTDTATETQLKQRRDALRQQEKDRNAEKRRVFRP